MEMAALDRKQAVARPGAGQAGDNSARRAMQVHLDEPGRDLGHGAHGFPRSFSSPIGYFDDRERNLLRRNAPP